MAKAIIKTEIDGEQCRVHIRLSEEHYRLYEQIRIEDPELNEMTALRLAKNILSKKDGENLE